MRMRSAMPRLASGPASGPVRRAAARLARDERGTITMEFVIWLPILVFWFVVSASFFQAFKSRNDAANVAHALTDILSRQVEVNDAFFTELYALQGQLLPDAPAGATLRVSNIQYDATLAQYTVLWSNAIGGPQPLPAGPVSSPVFPEMAAGDTVVLVEFTVPYTAFTDWDGVGNRTWSFSLVTRPRFVSSIAHIG